MPSKPAKRFWEQTASLLRPWLGAPQIRFHLAREMLWKSLKHVGTLLNGCRIVFYCIHTLMSTTPTASAILVVSHLSLETFRDSTSTAGRRSGDYRGLHGAAQICRQTMANMLRSKSSLCPMAHGLLDTFPVLTDVLPFEDT